MGCIDSSRWRVLLRPSFSFSSDVLCPLVLQLALLWLSLVGTFGCSDPLLGSARRLSSMFMGTFRCSTVRRLAIQARRLWPPSKTGLDGRVVPRPLGFGEGRPCRCNFIPSPKPALLPTMSSHGGGPQVLQLGAPLYIIPCVKCLRLVSASVSCCFLCSSSLLYSAVVPWPVDGFVNSKSD